MAGDFLAEFGESLEISGALGEVGDNVKINAGNGSSETMGGLAFLINETVVIVVA